jgi:AraC-like DNA-binding protein
VRVKEATAAEFLENPVGRYTVAGKLLAWVPDAGLICAVIFDRASDEELALRRPFWSLPAHPLLAPPLTALLDYGEITAWGESAFQLFAEFLEDLGHRWPGTLHRVAIVRPSGATGAAVAGVFYEQVRPNFESALFTDRAEGLAWLRLGESASIAAQLDELVAAVHGTPAILRALRMQLAQNLRDAAIDRIAAALGVSVRSLQRRLGELATSYRAEVNRARVRAAEGLLVGGNEKVEAIAHALGVSSAAHFAQMFRELTGETPSDFRARRRPRRAARDDNGA